MDIFDYPGEYLFSSELNNYTAAFIRQGYEFIWNTVRECFGDRYRQQDIPKDSGCICLISVQTRDFNCSIASSGLLTGNLHELLKQTYIVVSSFSEILFFNRGNSLLLAVPQKILFGK